MPYGIIEQGLVVNMTIKTILEADIVKAITPSISVIEELGSLFRFADGDTSTIDNKTVLSANGGTGRRLQVSSFIGQDYMNAYNSSSSGLLSTPTGIIFDSVRENSGIVSFNIDEIIFSNTDKYYINVVFSTTTSTTTRNSSGFYIAKRDGTNRVKINGTNGFNYNRTTGNGETTSSASLIYDAQQGDKIKIMGFAGTTSISTIDGGCSITMFKFGGPRGEKGAKGDVGPSGDINRIGTYDNGTTYNVNDTVEYLGSSYRCNTNGTLGDTPPSINRDLVSKKGADGSGSSVNVSENGTIVENSSNINFVGFESVNGNGSGTTTITQKTPGKIFYMFPIRAEEGNGLSTGSYERAFGNGANTPNDGGITIYIPAGYKAEIVAMSLRVGGGTAIVEVVVNGILQGNNCNVNLSSGQGTTNDSFSPVLLSNGDYINFHTNTANGTSGPCVATMRLKYTEL